MQKYLKPILVAVTVIGLSVARCLVVPKARRSRGRRNWSLRFQISNACSKLVRSHRANAT